MTIPYSIQIGNPLDKKQISDIECIIANTFAEIDSIYNNWNPHSEISHLNQLQAYEKTTLSDELATLLKKVDLMVLKTEGRFDPTVEPLHQLWKEALQSGNLPEHEKIIECSSAIGWHLIHIEGNTFWKEKTLTALDLGGIAKGYGVDLLAERLKELGLTKIYVEWGGEIRTIGTHGENRPWKIGIQGHSIIDLSDQAIATSGSYLQNWNVEGICYTHIIDPKTAQPLQNGEITSASIIYPTCCEADAFATALMLFPSQAEALCWAEKTGLQVFIW